MKKIFTYLTVAGAALFAAACDPNNAPVFDDSNAFVGFSSTRVTVSESVVKKSGEMTEMGDTVFIPVTLGSVAGLAGSATYTIVPDTTKDGVYPEEGIHYELVDNDGTGTLKFDADNRTRYIGIAGKLYDEYTGDLSVKITVKASSGLKTGAQDVCTVVITDVNHPLSSILGEYTASSETDASQNPWTMTLLKDKEDDHKVWIDNIFANSSWAGDDMLYYGNVNADLTKIEVPFGQKSEYKYSGTYEFVLFGMDLSDEEYDTGSLEITIVDASGSPELVFDPEMGVMCAMELGYIGYAYPPIAATKN